MDPYHQDREVREYCEQNNILYQSYSSLGGFWRSHLLLDFNPFENDPVLTYLANKYDRSVYQIILKWLLQLNVAVLPSSQRNDHIAENAQIMDSDLTPGEMAAIATLNGQEPKRDVLLVFKNECDESINIFWTDPSSGSGAEYFVKTVPPEKIFRHNSI
eukprot:UN29164